MFKVAVGQSEDVLIEEAVREVLDQLHASLGDCIPQAGILFCALDFDHTYVLTEIRKAFPFIQLIGCTTDGEISSIYGFAEDSIVLMVFVTDEADITAGIGRNISQLGEEAGRNAAMSATSGIKRFQDQKRFAIMLTDPLNAGVSNIDSGIAEVLGEAFPLIGAASAAHSKRRTTFQFCNGEVATDSVVLLLFSGPVSFSFGIQGGHAPICGKAVVTEVDKNVLYKIGAEPAINYFRRYIGDKYGLFMNYCLAVFEEGREGFYVRSAPFYDLEKGTVTLNGIVSKGSMVQIGTSDKDVCVSSCQASIKSALENYPGKKPSAALCFSCAGRKMILGTEVIKEVNTIKELIGDIPYCGFYAYGEFSPMRRGSKSLFHGTTFVTLLIGTD